MKSVRVPTQKNPYLVLFDHHWGWGLSPLLRFDSFSVQDITSTYCRDLRLVSVFKNIQVIQQRTCFNYLLVSLCIPRWWEDNIFLDRRILKPCLLGHIGDHVRYNPEIFWWICRSLTHRIGCRARANDVSSKEICLTKKTCQKKRLPGPLTMPLDILHTRFIITEQWTYLAFRRSVIACP